jgi:hypothetical protein
MSTCIHRMNTQHISAKITNKIVCVRMHRKLVELYFFYGGSWLVRAMLLSIPSAEHAYVVRLLLNIDYI